MRIRPILSYLFIFMQFCISCFVNAKEHEMRAPPPNLPVEVHSSFYLLNFTALNERQETFQADVYFIFRWNDPRLAFDDTDQVESYLERAAEDKLNSIWWPQIEFLNSGIPEVRNRALFIYSNGDVEYYISLTASFWSSLDFTQFPFDRQKLYIRVDSFLWNEDVVRFVPSGNNELVNSDAKMHNDLIIFNTTESIEQVKGLSLDRNIGQALFSSYVITFEIKRNANFFIYQIFIPLIVVVIIIFSIFFGQITFSDRLAIALNCLLVFVAAKFTINLDLPNIEYMTLIDKTFVLAYISIGLVVLISMGETIWTNDLDRAHYRHRVDLIGRWLIPLFFIVGLFLTFFIF